MTATVDSAGADLQRTIAELQRRLDAALAERDAALDQQTATAEVLQVINSSPGDLTPVFAVILEKAQRLCGVTFGTLELYDGQNFRAVATLGISDALAALLAQGHPAGGIALPLIEGARYNHILDQAEHANSINQAAVELDNHRTILLIPLRREGRLLGMLVSARKEVRAFTENEIIRLENFAAQAVIAMENARLITETREALEQQTATAEVLGVINSSPGDLTPVFDALLDRAMRLCEANFGALALFEGAHYRAVAMRGVPSALAELVSRPVEVLPTTNTGRLLFGGEEIAHVADITTLGPEFRNASLLTMIENGARTGLWISLRKEGAATGFLIFYRQEVRPFTDKQIALLQNFAAQAVIAMENARLITETQEALDQQTAIAEVLQVINANPGDLHPVFDVILEKAMALCDVAYGDLELYDGETFRAVVTRGLTDAFAEQVRRGYPAGDNPATRRLIAGERFSHIVNMAEADFSKVFAHAPAKDEGHQTLLCVPLRRENVLLGMIACARREVRAFSEKEIALLESFAAQAVIAMENARLISETRQRTAELQESLEYQTATSDVLQVIGRSTFDLQPVLDAVVETAARLCAADMAHLINRQGEDFRAAAGFAHSSEFDAFIRKQSFAPARHTVAGRVLLDGKIVHLEDIAADAEFGLSEAIHLGRIRSILGVPLLREAEPIGVLVLARQRVEPFSYRQIELVRTFADQAVIAIENARLLGEIRQRQAELRVTFDNMADGVAMFDEGLHLAAWNRNFQQMLDLPEDFLAEHHSFDEYIRYLTARGEFGETTAEAEIARLRVRLAEHHSFERTRPDGGVIEVRHSPMPEGGIVLIYSDITERKRSEAEIRAARDAAEAAYRDLKAAQANLVQAEKMASLGQLTAGIAHEIKNPLNFVNNFASLSVELLDELKETTASAISSLGKDKRAEVDETMEMLTGNLEKIAEHGKRADNIVKSMLEHSRGVSGERREVDLNQLVEEALNLAYHGARAQDQTFNITLERDYASALKPIVLAPQEITRVFLNLFGNGFYAANKRARENGDGSFRPSVSVATRDDGDAVEVRVRDNGTGIPAGIRDKLFQPFFTTKPTGEGTGLGLSISYDIVTQQHGGSIAVDSEPGLFTEFTIRLPRQQPAAN